MNNHGLKDLKSNAFAPKVRKDETAGSPRWQVLVTRDGLLLQCAEAHRLLSQEGDKSYGKGGL